MRLDLICHQLHCLVIEPHSAYLINQRLHVLNFQGQFFQLLLLLLASCSFCFIRI